MAVSTIDQFKKNLDKLGGLARSNLFAVQINLPTKFFMYSNCQLGDQNVERKRTLRLLCRSALLPGSQLASIDVPYRGMGYKIPGERVFEPITLTFMNDAKHVVRNTFIDWHTGLRHVDNNYMFNHDKNNVNFFGNMRIDTYYRDKYNKSKNRHMIPTAYKFYGLWPTMIGAIELDSASNDQVQEFTVQFEYQNYRMVERDDTRNMIRNSASLG